MKTHDDEVFGPHCYSIASSGSERDQEHGRLQLQHTRNTTSPAQPADQENNSSIFPCNICGKYFATRDYFKIHKASEHPEVSDLSNEDEQPIVLLQDPRLQCTVCKQRFDKKQSLLRHSRTVHALQEDKQFKCDVCNKWLHSQSFLNDHMNRHTGLKPYTCSLCGKGYYHETSKRRHEKAFHQSTIQDDIFPLEPNL